MKWFAGRFRCAFQGMKAGLADSSIRMQMFGGLMAIAAGLIFEISAQEWLWVLLAAALVIGFEFLNSCIERTVDYISLEKNPKAGQIKDMAAAAVLTVSIFAFCTGCFIFIPRLLMLLK
ncbi:MAG: diacylglycerol kinase family protein [Muribaculaceae bacterium]|nr:diacylglycerol kinase family protein [Muribaculaceae bacterium]MCF0258643.1 diacylglycerol kinase family protein [Erysipelotrichaceae bacterium]